MLSDKILTAINEQITKELYSSYLYFQMAAWFDNQTMPGFAVWMRAQAQEEIAHATIFYNYVNERGGFVEMGAIDKPNHEYTSALDVFEKTLAHEQLVTSSINSIMDLAVDERDYATQKRLEWFIEEQVEEEANPAEIIGKLNMIGDAGNGLYMLDKELGARVFTMPSPLAAE
jgi:ferritin